MTTPKTSEPAMPDFGLIVTLLDHWGWRGLSKDLRAWLAQREQPAAADGECPDCGRVYTDYAVRNGLNVPCGNKTADGGAVSEDAAKLSALIEVLRPALGLGGTSDEEFTPELMAKTVKYWREEGHQWFLEVMNRGGEIMELRAQVAALSAAAAGVGK